ncbi:MAG: acyltransferase [Xanthomonadales bacterium]|nr:acyltransferase [Xanthomonadales bacterium]
MLINIQFLRFSAAMLVVFYHCSAHVRATGVNQGLFFSICEAVGFAGVDIFFVISGFIMAYTSTDATGIEPGLAFTKRRLARIYSGYWPFYILALALFAWIGENHLADAALFRSAILWPSGRNLIQVSWTLIYELYFYLVFGLIIVFTGSKRKLLLQLMLAAILVWSIYSHFIRHAFDQGQLEVLKLSEVYMLSPYMAEFLVGSLLASWLTLKQKGRSWSWLLSGIVLFMAGGWLNNVLFDGQIEQGYYIFWRVMIFGTASILLLIGLVRLEFSGKTAPVTFSLVAGGASYAIYLCHTLWLTFTQHLGFNRLLGDYSYSSWLVHLVFLGYAVLILFYSILHYRFLEQPLHGLFKKWLN